MKFNYRKSYLADGTQVKITEELYQQFIKWEQEGYDIPLEYSDMLKREDNAMIKANRNYYIHNIPLDEHMLRGKIGLKVMIENENDLEDRIMKKDRYKMILKVLNICSEAQKRRFIKHYYLGYSYAEIAEQENCSKQSVHESIAQTEKLLINCKQRK
jgi:hypothetical protein